MGSAEIGGILLDTHVWLWYLDGSPDLPRGLREAVDQAFPEVWLSPVSVWEAALLSVEGRLETPPSFREWYDAARSRLPAQDAPLTAEVALVSREIDLPHQDPADRFIGATAIVYDLTLLTADSHLRKNRAVRTRSR